MRVKIDIECDRMSQLLGYLFRCIYHIRRITRQKKEYDFTIGDKFIIDDEDSKLNMEIFPEEPKIEDQLVYSNERTLCKKCGYPIAKGELYCAECMVED